MAQRPKFSVHKKSSLIAILQKLKPCIYAQCAAYLSDKKVEEGNQYNPEEVKFCLQGMAAGNQSETKENMILAKFKEAKSIWQDRLKRGSQKLPSIQEVTKSPRQGLNDNPSQEPIAKAVEDFEESLPIKQYIKYKLQELRKPSVVDGILEHPITIEVVYYEPKFVIALQKPQFGSRLEFNLSSAPRGSALMRFLFNWNAAKIDLIPQILLPGFESTLPIPPVEDDNGKLSEGIESISQTGICNLVKFAPFWRRNLSKFSTWVLTFFIVFFAIGFLLLYGYKEQF